MLINTLQKPLKAQNAGCLNVVTDLHVTFKVTNMLLFKLKSCTRYSFTLLSNTNRAFPLFLGHVTSYNPLFRCARPSREMKGYYANQLLYFQQVLCLCTF